MKKTITTLIIATISFGAFCQTETEIATDSPQEKSADKVTELITGATELLGPIGGLVKIATEQLTESNKWKDKYNELKPKYDGLKQSSEQTRTAYNNLVNDLKSYNNNLIKVNSEYKSEMDVLNQIFSSTQRVRSYAFFFQANTELTLLRQARTSGNVYFKWWLSQSIKQAGNRIMSDLKTIKELDLTDVDRNLASRLNSILKDLDDLKTDLSSFGLTGNIISSNNIEDNESKFMETLSLAIDAQTIATDKPIQQLISISAQLESTLSAYNLGFSSSIDQANTLINAQTGRLKKIDANGNEVSN